MFAAKSGNKKQAKYLLDNGSDPNVVGHMFATALNWAKTEEIREMPKRAGTDK